MSRIWLAAGLSLLCATSFAQLTTAPSGGNKKATAAERIGITDVTVHYDRPHVNGREGKIWGTLVRPGFVDQGFGSSKAAPWRAGANENTTMTFSTDVKINGQDLPAGTYGFFIAYGPDESTLIFSKTFTSWGSFYYDEKDDALRVRVKPVPLDKPVEWLSYEFLDETDSSATLALQWEKLSIPFTVSIDVINTQLASFRNQLRNSQGFTWTSWDQAAQWCLQHHTNYDQALLWADSATGQLFGGSVLFAPQATKAQVLAALGRNDEAVALMKSALPLGNMLDLHQYGRQLISAKKPKDALDVFKMNASKFPKVFTTYVGLARGYSANGDYKNALKNAELALPLAPDPLNKAALEAMIPKLKDGKDIN